MFNNVLLLMDIKKSPIYITNLKIYCLVSPVYATKVYNHPLHYQIPFLSSVPQTSQFVNGPHCHWKQNPFLLFVFLYLNEKNKCLSATPNTHFLRTALN